MVTLLLMLIFFFSRFSRHASAATRLQMLMPLIFDA